jgi:hypothetical protein
MADLANVFLGHAPRWDVETPPALLLPLLRRLGGWAERAAGHPRLYVLKQLTGRQGWGTHVHSAVELCFARFTRGRSRRVDTVRRMREEWRVSRREATASGRRTGYLLRRYGVEAGLAWQVLRDHVALPATSTGCRLRGDPAHATRALDPDRGRPRVRARRHADLRGADFGYWTRDDRLAGRLEDRQPDPRRRRPSWAGTRRRAGHPGGGPDRVDLLREPPGGEVTVPGRARLTRSAGGSRSGRRPVWMDANVRRSRTSSDRDLRPAEGARSRGLSTGSWPRRRRRQALADAPAESRPLGV